MSAKTGTGRDESSSTDRCTTATVNAEPSASRAPFELTDEQVHRVVMLLRAGRRPRSVH